MAAKLSELFSVGIIGLRLQVRVGNLFTNFRHCLPPGTRVLAEELRLGNLNLGGVVMEVVPS
eukprot:681275-Rhodomonas_salina.1